MMTAGEPHLMEAIEIPNFGFTELTKKFSYEEPEDSDSEIDRGVFKKTFLRRSIPNKTLNAILPKESTVRAFATEDEENSDGEVIYAQPQLLEVVIDYDGSAIDEFHRLDKFIPGEIDIDIAELEYYENSWTNSFELFTMELNAVDDSDAFLEEKLKQIVKKHPQVKEYLREFRETDLGLFDLNIYSEYTEGDTYAGSLKIFDLDKSWSSHEKVIPKQIYQNVDLGFELWSELVEPVREGVNAALEPVGIQFNAKDDINDIDKDAIDLDLIDINFTNDVLLRNSPIEDLLIQPYDLDFDSRGGNTIELLDIRYELRPEQRERLAELVQQLAAKRDQISHKFPMKEITKGQIITTEEPHHY